MFWRLFLYSNIFIGICTASLYLHTSISNNIPTDYPLLAFIFFSTGIIYSLHRIIALRKNPIGLKENERMKILLSNSKLFHISAIISISGAILSIFFMDMDKILLFILPGFLSFGYILPIFSKRKRLRDMHYLKVFLVAIAWAWTTAIIPLANNYSEINNTSIIFFAERFLFILAIAIPFDIRDKMIDEGLNVLTIPRRFGIKRTKIISISLLLLAFIFAIIFFTPIIGIFQVISNYGITYLTTAIIINRLNYESPDWIYSGLIDGMMILLLVTKLIF